MSISVHNVSFSYDPTRRVLTRVCLEANPGELVVILGPSGSGKSTILRLIAGLLPGRAAGSELGGRILLNGSPPTSPIIRPGTVSLMFQEPVLLPNRTVEQNIMLPLQMLHATSDTIAERVNDSLDQIGLAPLRHLRPSQLSVGMKTRVSLAMTIVTQPSFLLLDEPFSSLDIAWRLALYRTLGLVRRFAACTTILVTHDLREAILLGDTIVVLGSDGRTLDPIQISFNKPSTFTPEELTAYNERSIELYSALERSILATTVLGNDHEAHS
jgi:ABC-type nitrate/sulfonate/bicarbonate transport system ATPase subunit